MANLIGTTVTGDLAVTGATSGQGAVPIGAVIPIVSALSGSHTIPNTGTVDADGWQYCDGAVIPSSQTLSGTTPDLTDGRFLRGFTSSSGCGGAATFTLALGNLAAHDHGGATTSGSTTPGAGGSTTPGAGGSTTPGASGACSATTGACGQTSATSSANHTHAFSTGAQNCQHCHCICDAGSHSHTEGGRHGCYDGGDVGGGWRGGYSGNNSCGTDGRHHCAEHTCCTLSAVTHIHSGTSAGRSADHTHTTPSHTHTIPSHTHTGAAHTHTGAAHTHTGAAHTHSTTIASAGSGTAKSHIPIYFNVKYLIRVI
tara:strand:- start:528 stop:1466 length:939 start_codon:yes stop_codon:yes gene_type:complete